MRVKEFFSAAIETGISADPRGSDAVQRELSRRKSDFDAMKDREKEFFDSETLTNPYSDSRVLHCSSDIEVRGILAGIDIETAEILLADTLRKSGSKIDLIVAHHPEGTAFANLYSVMGMQSDILNRFGVPINVAEGLMEGRAKEVERRLMPMNHSRAVDAARLLDIPFACLHTPADNMVVALLQSRFDSEKPERVSDVVDLLLGIPEYRDAACHGAGPKVLLGSKERRAGRIFVDMTGGTEGAKDVFRDLTAAGVNTIVAMHLSEEHRKEAEKNHLNVVIAGHIASDNLGMNLLLDGALKGADVEVLACSGFRRIVRN